MGFFSGIVDGLGGWLGIGGAALDFVGGMVSANEQRRAGNANARAAEEAAERERERTRLRLERLRKEGQRIRGEQMVQFAASGVTGGSALDIMADTASEIALDAQLIEAGGDLSETYYRNVASQSRREGRGAFTGGLLSSSASLLSNSYQIARNWS